MDIFQQMTQLKEMELNYRNLFYLQIIAYGNQEKYNQLWKICTYEWEKVKNKFGEGNNLI